MSSGFLAPQPKKRTSVLKSSFLLQKRLGKNLLRYRKSNTKHALNITLLASNSTPLRQPPWQSTTLEICISSSHRRAVGTREGRGATAGGEGALDFGRYGSRTFAFKRFCLTTLPLPDFQIILRTCTARRFCIGGKCLRLDSESKREVFPPIYLKAILITLSSGKLVKPMCWPGTKL